MRPLAIAFLAATALSAREPGAAPHAFLSPVDLAVSADGSQLYVVCEGSDELLVVDTRARQVVRRIPVGHVPRGVVLSLDGRRAYVSGSWADSIADVDLKRGAVARTLTAGFEPIGLARVGQTLYAANRLSNDISVIDLVSGKESVRLAAGRGASFLAAAPDGSRVYTTHVYPNLGKHRTPPESEITEVDAAHGIIANREGLHNVGGVFGVAVSRDGRLGVAAQLRPKNLIPLAHVEHGWVFVDSIALFGADVNGAVVQMPLDEVERYFSLPYAVAIAPDKRAIYVSAAGSDEIAVLSVSRLLAAASQSSPDDLSLAAKYIEAFIPTGRNPKAMALSPNGSRLYVANKLDDSISVIDTRGRTVAGTILLGGPRELTPERRGEQLFNSSRFSFHGSFACANCHVDATFDGMQWDLEPDGFGIDIVDNRSLEDVSNTAPFKWNGGNPDLETECGPRTERFFFRSAGFSRSELADLVAYIKAIPLRPNRYRLANGELTPAQERGKAIFERTAKRDGTPIPVTNQCPTCHSGRYYTNQKLADVGSRKWNDRSGEIDVAHLTNVVYTAPYLHDGSARTLEEIWTVFSPHDTHGVTNDLNKDELNDLIEYIRTL